MIDATGSVMSDAPNIVIWLLKGFSPVEKWTPLPNTIAKRCENRLASGDSTVVLPNTRRSLCITLSSGNMHLRSCKSDDDFGVVTRRLGKAGHPDCVASKSPLWWAGSHGAATYEPCDPAATQVMFKQLVGLVSASMSREFVEVRHPVTNAAQHVPVPPDSGLVDGASSCMATVGDTDKQITVEEVRRMTGWSIVRTPEPGADCAVCTDELVASGDDTDVSVYMQCAHVSCGHVWHCLPS